MPLVIKVYFPFKSKFVPDRERSVISDETVRLLMFVGHVAAMTQVIVVTYSALPADTA